ncbi:hypothetical protein ARMSODRAFT_1078439 [Armillaria solidipes]|uniref:Uncharacterized protein n=1 Tax=Armillaria solidipes TaxID=1076256 RepID=A0A2H3CHK1_9AGAR|nr:hypothetical protein ARMSODRAFT_1078439 [Armillaria solidipes]
MSCTTYNGGTDIPPDLPDNVKSFLFHWYLDANLNSLIFYALLHGMYTGILAVALWNIFINKCLPIRRALVIIIILLYALITISFAVNWSLMRSAFIRPTWRRPTGITASISTLCADLYMIWCCWMVWGRRWLIVLFPILSLISATVLIAIEMYCTYVNTSMKIFNTLYISSLLATSLWCTFSIIFRVLTVTGVRHGTGGRLRVYYHFIGVLVESLALYSISMIIYLALVIRNDWRLYYFSAIAGVAKGVAPTLLIGRAAAGHTRPNDDSDESTVSTLHFQASSGLDTASLQESESTRQSAVLEMDIEAQQEQSDELVVVVERTQ